MADLHPHWRATGDKGDTSIQPRSVGSTRVKIEGQRVSRAPAAIMGILVVLTIAFTFFRGWELIHFNVLGQANVTTATSSSSSSSTITIRVTPVGIAPTSVVTTPGSPVTIVNNDSVPHIFSSKTLRDGSGKILETPAIFSGTSYTFRIYGSEVSGEHKMASTTTTSAVVTFTVVPATVSSSSSANARPLGGLDDVPLPSGMGNRSSTAVSSKSASSAALSSAPSAANSVPMASSGATSSVTSTSVTSSAASSVTTPTPVPVTFATSSSATAVSSAPQVSSTASISSATVASTSTSHSSSSEPGMGGVIVATTMTADASGIPLNPYTVGKHPSAPQTQPPAAPTKPITTTRNAPAKAVGTLHSGAQLARTNSKTGPELWIALVGGMVGLLVFSRRQLRAIAGSR